jgi:hypothetical protein
VGVVEDPSQSVAANSTGWVAVLSNGDFYINVREEDLDGGFTLPHDSKGSTESGGQPQAI